MPFFDADKFTVSLQLDSSRPLVLGGCMVGSFTLDVSEPCTARSVVMRYSVKEYKRRAPNRLVVQRPDLGCASATMHRVEYVMVGGPDSEIPVRPGHYTYPFNIPIPLNLPPSTKAEAVGTGSHCCCCRCCNCCTCCGEFTNRVRIIHRIKVIVVIPRTFKDTKRKWELTVLRTMDPTMRSSQRPDSRVCECVAYAFSSCCCSLFELNRSSLTLKVANPFISLRDDQDVRFKVEGVALHPFSVQLVRRSVFADQTERVGEDIVAQADFCASPPTDGPSVVEGSLFLNPAAHRWIASFSSATVLVDYFVTVALQVSGCCAGESSDARLEVPVCLFHTTGQEYGSSLMSQPTPGLFPPTPFTLQNSGFLPTVSGPMTYAYAPPSGLMNRYNPAGGIQAQLPTAVWGTVLGEPPNFVDVSPLGQPALPSDSGRTGSTAALAPAVFVPSQNMGGQPGYPTAPTAGVPLRIPTTPTAPATVLRAAQRGARGCSTFCRSGPVRSYH